MTVVELLSQALHFPMHGKKQPVHFLRVQQTIAVGQCPDRFHGFAIAKFGKGVQNLPLANGEPLQRVRIVLNNQVRDFRLRWTPRRKHFLSVPRTKSNEKPGD